MSKTKTSLKAGENLPPRGRAFKTILFEVIREGSLIDVPEGATRDDAEKAFITHAAKRAFDSTDNTSGTVLNEFLKRTFPPLKQTQEAVSFEFPSDGTPSEKAFAVVDAISAGLLPADVGQTVIAIIKDSVVIKESTELEERIAQLEAVTRG